jgi:hypothetical protein
LHAQLARMAALKSAPKFSQMRPHASTTNDDSEEGEDDAQPTQSFDGPFDIDKFIYTVKGAGSGVDVTPDFLQQVKREVNKLPHKLLAQLQSRGCKMCATPRLSDKLPNYRNTRPRGWEEGYTGKNVDGLFDGTDVLVCEYSANVQDDTSLVKNARIPYIVRHESGHAFDHYFGDISSSPEFKHTYYLELAKMDPDQKDAELAYFAQKSDAGPSECFAELFAIMNGGGASKNIDAHLLPIFPECSKMIRQRLGF